MTDSQLPALLDILTLTQEGDHVYRGSNLFIGNPTVYGGQVLAQALSAAAKTVTDGKKLHSMHCYFIHPGDNEQDILYTVEVIKEGRSFNTRRVVGSQNGKDIFIMSASYQSPEEGITHQASMPNVAQPESLTSFSELFAEFSAKFGIQPRGIFSSSSPFIFHPVEKYDPFQPHIRPAINHTWFKTNGQLPDDPEVHLTTLAYASDFNLLITALFPHGLSFFTTPMQIASLDHAMWFHRPARTDEWLLYVVESSNANAGRALCSGKIFTKEGVLVASTVQEGLIRKL